MDVHNAIVRDSGLDQSRQRVDLNAIFKEVDDEHVEQWKEQCTRALARKRDNSSKICSEWTTLNDTLMKGRQAEKDAKATPIKQPKN